MWGQMCKYRNKNCEGKKLSRKINNRKNGYVME